MVRILLLALGEIKLFKILKSDTQRIKVAEASRHALQRAVWQIRSSKKFENEFKI